MDTPPGAAAEEAASLRRCLNDLVGIIALPALWAGGEPPRIVGTVLDALFGTLGPAFVLARLNDPEGGPPIEMGRVAEPWEGTLRTREIGKALDASLGDGSRSWPPDARVFIGGIHLSVASVRLGLHGDIGAVIVGSERIDFPGQTERLILDVAANQAAIGLQQARLLSAQRRVAAELDEHVAQRTRELAAANEALQREVTERRRVQQALTESEKESRLIVDSIPGLVSLLDATGGVELVNPQVLEYTGRTLEELKEWGTSDIVHPEDLPHVIDVFTRSIASGSPYEIVQRLRRADGVYRWFQNSGCPIRDTNDQVVRWCVLLTDIDERKRAEEALAASKRNLTLIIDTIPALAWSACPDGSAEFFNQHYLDFIGLSAEQASGWGWTVAVHPEDLNELAAAWQRIMASEAPGEAEARLRRHDGDYRWFLFRANPFRDESGAIVKWYGVNTDIEDRKRGDDALRASERNLRQMAETIPEMLWSATAEGAIDYCNTRFLNYTGFSAEEVMGEGWQKTIHPDDAARVAPVWMSCVATGAQYRVEVRTFHATARTYRLCVVTALPLRDEQGHIVKWHGTIVDMHDWKQAEEELRNTQAALAHVTRVMTMGELTASIAHEVNQPLSGIVTNANTCLRMLAADPPNIDGARETARRTLRDGNRASEVIEQLRALFSKKEVTTEAVDLNDAIREVITLSSSELHKNRVILRSELAGHLPLVTGDRIQLQQVVLNLIVNASDAMSGIEDRQRQLLIGTTQVNGDDVVVTVRDTGVGFEPQSMNRLFSAFYTTKSTGMGMGLSVSRSIIARHHGRLWAALNDGPGATFSFAISCRRSDGTAAGRTSV